MGTGYPEKIDLFLQPGFLYGAPEPAVLRTVLAAGVAVCLWDPGLRIGGMNHFLCPQPGPDEPATPRTGVGATLGLIQSLQDAGAETGRLVAQILGGARRRSDPGDGTDLGTRNVEMARRLLARRAIGILSEDVGGTMGRKVIFDTQTGQLAVLKVHRLREADWPQADH
jgi:chemotaxis protein CheD